jgi:hypothetical protein
MHLKKKQINVQILQSISILLVQIYSNTYDNAVKHCIFLTLFLLEIMADKHDRSTK